MLHIYAVYKVSIHYCLIVQVFKIICAPNEKIKYFEKKEDKLSSFIELFWVYRGGIYVIAFTNTNCSET